MSLRAVVAFLSLLLTLPASARGGGLLSDSAYARAFADVYKIDNAAFERSVGRVSNRARAAFLREYMALMNYTAANSRENYDAYFRASDAAFDAADGSEFEANLLCQLHIHKCLVYLYDGSLLSGGIQFWKSYRQFKAAEDKYPAYDGQLPLRGLYNILLAQIPEKWKSLKGLLGLGEGDTAAGLRQIEAHRQRVGRTPGFADEALLFSFANMFFSHEQVLADTLLLAIRANETPVVRYAYVLSRGRVQDGAAASEALAASEEMARRFPLLYHQMGKYALRRLQPDETLRRASQFLSTYKGSSNRNWACLEMAYAYRLRGDNDSARRMVDRCLAIEPRFDIDKRARAEAALAMGLSVDMLRARLLFEYGRFAQSLEALRSFRPVEAEAAEHAFRTARAEDKLGDADEALRQYDRAIKLAAASTRYFAPYAAVHAADICMAKGDRAAALRYLATARSLNNGEYKKELDQRIELTERAVKAVR